jgi:pimeloyl-ACP methyl ester carboxylesterase
MPSNPNHRTIPRHATPADDLAATATIGASIMTDHRDPLLDPDDLAARSPDREVRSDLEGKKAARADIDDAEGDAPDVFLIHGQPGSSLIWTRVLPLLRSRGLHVLAVDRPGYGHTGGPAVDRGGNVAALVQILEERQDSPPVIVGHSLGAGIALALAATAPRQVRALVLIAPATGPSAITVTDWILAAPIIGPTLTWFGFRAAGWALHIPPLRQRILIKRIGLSATDAKEVVRRITHGHVWRSFTVEQRHLVTDAHRFRDQLRAIQCPVLIVAGARDRIVRPRAVAVLNRELAESIIIKTDTGHLIPVDDPGAVVKAVLRALRWDYRNSLRSPGTARPA